MGPSGQIFISHHYEARTSPGSPSCSQILPTYSAVHCLYGLFPRSFPQSKTFPWDSLKLNIRRQQNFLPPVPEYSFTSYPLWILDSPWGISCSSLKCWGSYSISSSWCTCLKSPQLVQFSFLNFESLHQGTGCGWRNTPIYVDSFIWILATNFIWPKQARNTSLVCSLTHISRWLLHAHPSHYFGPMSLIPISLKAGSNQEFLSSQRPNGPFLGT